ncbi:hypothetical protein [Halorubrum depositum]|uniref:hypothetical protein n=1 Tax=Halorubrum depositum TaxID=2583992 RepID=UPI0011A5D155|nr:hypothetical protein [Halorubrum depositum]
MTEGGSDGPGGAGGADRIRSIAVHREDVASALEATLRSDRDVVLRVTPPFSRRMRARLHAVDADAPDGRGASESDDGPAPIRVDPRDLVADVPPYPEVDETASDHPDADIERRRELHEAAVESWRERVRESIVSVVEVAVGDTTREVDVTALG